MNGNNSFKERQTDENKGELLFEKFCKSKNYEFYKLGFSEKTKTIDKFYQINKFIRNIPDYFVETKKGCFLVNVKGSANIKQEEIEMLPIFVEKYSTTNCPLVYAFCMENQPVYVLKPNKVMELYYRAEDRKWQSDGKIYRNLNVAG